MARRRKKLMAKSLFDKNKESFESNPPEVGQWVIYGIGSDLYGNQIELVSEDKKIVTTKDGITYFLNKWYIWLREGYERMIMTDYGWYWISKEDESYFDPSY